MIRFEYKDAENIQPLLQKTDGYTAHLKSVATNGGYEADESSINLVDDTVTLQAVKSLVAEKVSDKLRYHFVVGIGGSNLGAKAVYDAVYGFSDVFENERFPKLLFAETTDGAWLQKAVELIEKVESPDQILISVISKSGGTTETMANFEILAGALQRKFAGTERIVAITDEGSQLWQAATEKSIATLAVPKKVGGRYSVFSAVGLFPLATVGIDIDTLLVGAREVRDTCLKTANMAATSAVVVEYQRQDGKVISDTFMYHIELESLGKWYRQLMGESIGKKDSLDGETVHVGMTPTVSLGSTDLHSVGQLYLGGPKDKLTTFVWAEKSTDVRVPEERLLPTVTPMINHRSANEIMTAIRDGVKIAYEKAQLPYGEVIIPDTSAHSIGAFMQFKMMEIMYLGRLMNVNSFDQPSVESYKIETKQILEAGNNA